MASIEISLVLQPYRRPITRIKLRSNVPHSRNGFPKLKIENHCIVKKTSFRALDPLKRKILIFTYYEKIIYDNDRKLPSMM